MDESDWKEAAEQTHEQDLEIATNKGEYEYLVSRFARKNDLGQMMNGFTSDAFNQYKVYEEEVGEFEVAFHVGSDGEVVEEMADVLITLFLLAEIMDIDIGEAYNRKMEYNLKKTGEKNGYGKILDDADLEKPEFKDLFGGN